LGCDKTPCNSTGDMKSGQTGAIISARRKAIIWTLEPGPTDKRGCPSNGEMHVLEAMIHPYIYYAEEHGAVYFDRNFEVAEEVRKSVPMTGYIYIGRNVSDVPSARRGTVSYRCTVERILTLEELKNDTSEHRYVAPWTRQCLDGEWSDGTHHDPSITWIKASNITMLSRGYSPREMGIDADFIRGRAFVEDTDWR